MMKIDWKKISADHSCKREGFWRKTKEIPDVKLLFPENILPFPEAGVLTQEQALKIYSLIKEKQKHARKVFYLCKSFSRITGETLGNVEYEKDEWVWPGDFSEHYVLRHKVKPTDEFLKYIGYSLDSEEKM